MTAKKYKIEVDRELFQLLSTEAAKKQLSVTLYAAMMIVKGMDSSNAQPSPTPTLKASEPTPTPETQPEKAVRKRIIDPNKYMNH